MKKHVSTVLMVLVAVIFAVSAEAVSLSWMPQDTLFDPTTDTEVTVDIVLDGFDAMLVGGFDINLMFDSAVIDIAAVTWGYTSFLGTAIDNFNFGPPYVPERADGTLNLGDALFFGFDDPMATSGILASITFDILSKGSSLLEFTEESTTWLDISGDINGVPTSFDSLQVGSVAPVPEPGTMILLGSGLVGIFGARRWRA